MIVQTAVVRLYAPWVHSLKEKRMEVKSLVTKTRQRFNLSVAEIDEQDTHQTIVLGLACCAQPPHFAAQVIDEAVRFIERSTEAEVIKVTTESR